MLGADPGDAGAFAGRIRHLVLRAGRCTTAGASTTAIDRPARARARLRERGRRLAADHRVRRRQGPRPDPRRRRADLLRRRHRLPPRQARARLRPADQRARRRPPRLRRRGCGPRSRRSASTRSASRRRSCRWSTSSRAASGRGCRKRRGDFVTLDELIDDIGVDATRFFMLQRSHDTPIDIDLELARRASQDNPVYYVQYAHARICSLFRAAAERGRARRGGTIPARRRAALEPRRARPDRAAARDARARSTAPRRRREPHADLRPTS